MGNIKSKTLKWKRKFIISTVVGGLYATQTLTQVSANQQIDELSDVYDTDSSVMMKGDANYVIEDIKLSEEMVDEIEGVKSTVANGADENGDDAQKELSDQAIVEVLPYTGAVGFRGASRSITKADGEGIVTHAYDISSNNGYVMIDALIAHRTRDEQGEPVAANTADISVYLLSEDSHERIEASVRSTAQKKRFSISYHAESLKVGQTYRLIAQIGQYSEQIWTHTNHMRQVIQGADTYSRDKRVYARGVRQSGIATHVLDINAYNEHVSLTTVMTYYSRDYTGSRAVADVSRINAYLINESNTHRIEATIQRTRQPSEFNIMYRSNQLREGERYRIIGVVDGFQEQLWTHTNNMAHATPAMAIFTRHHRLYTQSPKHAGIATHVLHVEGIGQTVNMRTFLSYRTEDTTGKRAAASLDLISAYLIDDLGEHRVNIAVSPTDDNRLFDLTYHTGLLKSNRNYRIYGQIGQSQEQLWTHNKSLSHVQSTAEVYAKHHRLNAKIISAEGIATDAKGGFIDGDTVTILAHISYGNRAQNGQRLSADLSAIKAYLLSSDASHRIDIHVTPTRNAYDFYLAYNRNLLEVGTNYRIMAEVDGTREHIWTGGVVIPGHVFPQRNRLYANRSAELYAVKLIAKSGDIIKGSVITSPYREKAVSYFGQRFSVIGEHVKQGIRYMQLMKDGQSVGFVPKSYGVRVPTDKQTVFIDSGHGGAESGAQYFGVTEKELNLNISTQLADRLRSSGYIVYETMTHDKEVSLQERSRMSNALMPDIFVSIHHNAMPASYKGRAHGILTLYHDPSIDVPGYETLPHHPISRIEESRELAQTIQEHLISVTGAFDRKAKPQNLHVTRTNDVPAVLVELGFMDNPQEHRKLKTTSYQQTLIKGLYNGITSYLRKRLS